MVVARYRIVADDGSCRGWLHVTKAVFGSMPYHYDWVDVSPEREILSRGGFAREVDVLAFVYRWHARSDERFERVAE